MAIPSAKDMNVWSFWEGAQPIWVQECVKTIKRHIPQVVILDAAMWDDMRRQYDDSDVDLSGLSLNHKSDYIRVLLLSKLGGMWIDCDTIVKRPLDTLFAKAQENDLICPRDRAGNLLPGFMLSQAGGEIISAVREKQLDFLREGAALGWGGMMVDPLTEAEGDLHCETYTPQRRMVMPIGWESARVYERQGTDKEHAETWREFVGDANPWTFIMAHGTLKDSPLLMKHDSFFRYVLRRCERE